MQGRIACCNVLSDLYAMGIEHVDNVLMVLGISLKMNEKEKEVVTCQMIEGFDDCAKQANTLVTGGQTVYNPWPMIGGVGIAAVSKNEFIMPNNAEVGDLIVMTKALGTQLAVNAMQWLKAMPDKWKKIENTITSVEVEQAFLKGEQLMSTLNLAPARILKKYNGRASTDITGFGPHGHANLLAQCQKNKVTFKIHTLPMIKNMVKIDKLVHNFKLVEGHSAETSGGLLIVFPKDQAQLFIDELINIYGQHATLVGEVIEGNNTAIIEQNPQIIEIE